MIGRRSLWIAAIWRNHALWVIGLLLCQPLLAQDHALLGARLFSQEFDGLIRCADWSESDHILLLGIQKRVVLWDYSDGKKLWEAKYDRWPVSSVVLLDSIVAVAYTDGVVRILGRESGREIKRFQTSEAHRNSVVRLCSISANGELVLSATDEQGIEVWALQDAKQLQTWKSRIYPPCSAVAISPDGELSAVAFPSGNVVVWKSRSGELLREFHPGTAPVASLEFSESNEFLLAGEGSLAKPNGKYMVYAIDLAKGAVQTLAGHKSSVMALAVSAEANLAASGDLSGDVYVWDLAASRRVATHILGPDTSVYVTLLADRGTKLVVAGGLAYWGRPRGDLAIWETIAPFAPGSGP